MDEPTSDELAELYVSTSPSGSIDTRLTDYSDGDDLDALNATELESRRAKTAAGVVVQHRHWKTRDIFRSSISPAQTPEMTSSPPLSPSPKKRKLNQLDLGRSTLSRPVKAQRVYYGIDIHQLLEDAEAEESLPKLPKDLPTPPPEALPTIKKTSLLWTEKYRAKKFTDLIGDERIHRSVMHWLKRWDQIVFPGQYRKPKNSKDDTFDKPHRKILLLTGPPGLGKTTLAHVCAKQAGYEVQEINASDERSSSVVKGRIRDIVGTENVKSVDNSNAGRSKKAAKPVCVIVDEVDGVVAGSGAGGGEGGFIKALIDLVLLDQKNSAPLSTLQQAPSKKKGDRFRLLRPLILVCNDVYHPSLRPLRQSTVAEIIHVRKPAVENLVARLHSIFQREGIPCETDGVRKLCEATWGISNRKEDKKGNGAGEGDMRGIMVVGEWVASKLRAVSQNSPVSLTRKWVEDNILHDLAHGSARGLGRGGPKDIVERVFQECAGFPKSSMMLETRQATSGDGVGVAEGLRRTATQRLRELVDIHGETDRIMTDCFSFYPTRTFQDDTFLSKPDAAYEWLHFHDRLASAVFRSNEWELAPYLSSPILAFHHLFASPTRAQYESTNDDSTPLNPFDGPAASWTAHETQKQNEAHLISLQTSLSLHLNRTFTSTATLSTELQPYLLRMLTPAVNPTIIAANGKGSTATVRKASEQQLVARAVNAMSASGVRFDRVRVSNSSTDGEAPPIALNTQQQWIYRMEPPLDALCTFATGGKAFGEGAAGTRYAVRQVLEQEWTKEEKRRAEEARKARFGEVPASSSSASKRGLTDGGEESSAPRKRVARDFFGRPIVTAEPATMDTQQQQRRQSSKDKAKGKEEANHRRVWVTFHEGYSNAVRKPITLAEFLKDL